MSKSLARPDVAGVGAVVVRVVEGNVHEPGDLGRWNRHCIRSSRRRPPVIVVGGAICDRALTRPLAQRMSQQFTVFNYDRRGRGDSGDTGPYPVDRELEDLAAVIEQAGGTAAVYGHSSGAALVLRASAAGLPISKAVLHDPPFTPDTDDDMVVPVVEEFFGGGNYGHS